MIYWMCAKFFFKQENTFNLFFFTTIILQFFLQPTVLKEVVSPLLCYEIEGHFVMKTNMKISCEDSSYEAWVTNIFFDIKLNFLEISLYYADLFVLGINFPNFLLRKSN